MGVTKVLERDLERHFSLMCRRLGLLTIKMNLRGLTGCPDRLVFLPDERVAWVELKTLTGQLTARQKLFIGKMQDTGHPVSVLRTKEQITSFLQRLSESR
jgi:hypothetical protein